MFAARDILPLLEEAEPLELISAPFEIPEPDKVRLFCVAKPFKSSTAPELTVTLLVPKACAFAYWIVPLESVVSPEKELELDNVKELVEEVSFIREPVPDIDPVNVWLADEEICKVPALSIAPA